MATMTAVNEFRRATRDITALAQADLLEFVSRLDPRQPYQFMRAMAEYYPYLVATYGDFAALMAVEFFEELRSQKSLSTPYRGVMAPVVTTEQAQAVMRWAAGPLFAETPDVNQFVRNIAGATQRLVMQPARDSILTSIARDTATATWARIPSGTDTCAFCRILASRGAVYYNEKSALYKADGSKFHNDCDCVVIPIWDDEDFPTGFNQDALYREYEAAAEHAGTTTDLNAIVAAMRELQQNS